MRPFRAGLTLLFAAALVAACGSGETSSPAAIPTAAPSAGGTGTSAAASSQSGTASPSPARSAGPTTKVSGSPAASKPAGSGAVDSAPSGSIDPTVCAGSDANRAFFRDVAAQVTWDVYCPTLPKAWNVDVGNFRAASGGSLVISYKTSTGLRVEVKEGAICTGTAAECAPMESSLGSAAFGDRAGQLGKLSGNLVLYVSAGANPAWQATGTGLDEASFRAICAGLLKVAG